MSTEYKIEALEKKTESLENDFKTLGNRLNNQEQDLVILKHRLETLKDTVAELKGLSDTIRNVKYTAGAVLLAGVIFFGFTYHKLGDMINASISKHIDSTVFKESETAVRDKSKKAQLKIEIVSDNAYKDINSITNDLKKQDSSISTSNIEMLKTLSKLNSYSTYARGQLKIIDGLIDEAKSLVPSFDHFSAYGTAENGGLIIVPDGTIADWSIMISPRYIGPDEHVLGANTPILSADYSVRPNNKTSWKVSATTRYKFGASVKTYNGAINYLLVPSTLRNKN